MKKIKEVLTFLVLLIIIIIIVNLAYTKIILPKNKFYVAEMQYQEYIKNEKSINFAIFGESRAKNSMNPKFIPNSFNFANGGMNYILIYRRLEQVIQKDQVKIKYVVLGYDLHTFSSKMYEEPNLIGDLWFWHRLISSEEIHNFSGKSYFQIFIESNFPFIEGGDGLESFRKSKKEEIKKIYFGWDPLEGNFSSINQTKAAIKDYRLHFLDIKERISPLGIEYFKKTLILAKENNISIILIKYPLSESYDKVITEKGIDKDEYYQNLSIIVNKILKDYPYEILDYSGVYLNNSEYFADSSHLNSFGAEIFSKKFTEDMKSYTFK